MNNKFEIKIYTALIVFSIVALATLYALTTHLKHMADLSTAREASVSAAVYNLQNTDLALDATVHNIRSGIENNYDTLVDLDEKSHKYLQNLVSAYGALKSGLQESWLKFSNPVDSYKTLEEMMVDIAAYQNTLEKRRQSINNFKSRHAILLNSQRNLPVVAQRLIEDLSNPAYNLEADEQTALNHAIKEILVEGAYYLIGSIDNENINLNEDHIERITDIFDQIDTYGKKSSSLANKLKTFRRHNEVLAYQKEQMNQVLKDIVQAKHQEQIRHINKLTENLNLSFSNRVNTYILATYTLAGFLVLLVIISQLRLLKSAAMLKSTNDALNNALLNAKATQLEAEAAQVLERKANTAKSEFLANMSHELRTPLNSIIGMVQLLSTKKLDKDMQETFSLINSSSKILLDIVNDILDLSKIEAGEVHLEYLAFDAIHTIRHTQRALNTMAEDKGLHLSYIEEMPSLYVLGDQLRLGSILTNLVSNAIRYTEKGRVEVRVSVKEGTESTAIIRCEVQDTGIGISPEKIDSIFDKFTQADNSFTRKFGGTGLGLTITNELIDLMDGEIGVESEVGKGSTFWFEIPFEVINELPEAKTAARIIDSEVYESNVIPITDARILMAEDHEMNQIFMKKLFKELNIKNYRLAENGKEAVKQVESGNYDLVLMDCHMPEMDGYDATVAIRDLPEPIKSNIPIIAMTANAMPEDEIKCLDIGMDAYIAKPVNLDVFRQKLSRWVNFDTEDTDDIHEGNRNHEPQSEGINLDNLRENAMGDEDFVKEMIGMFASQGVEQIAALKEQCTDGENNEWVEISHALKGTAGGVGAMTMRDTCATAQNMADASKEEREKILSEIQNLYEEAKTYFIEQNLHDDK